MKNSFSAKRIILSIVVVIVPLLFILSVRIIQVGFNSEKYIFADISECENLLKVSKNATLDLYDTPGKDDAWNNNSYNAFWGANYISSDLNFEIFAYEFADFEVAKEYYRSAANKEAVFDVSFSMSTGLFGVLKLTVIDDNNVYHIRTTAKDYSELTALLSECFSVDVLEKLANEQ